ncbi:MAG: serine/threonine-protein phosphatase [Actinomycetales bacterium]|nr:serine/threonine-protein phosphatase [Actinomycetales bacterium]
MSEHGTNGEQLADSETTAEAGELLPGDSGATPAAGPAPDGAPAQPRPALRFHFAARSDVGSVREQNEDSGFATSHSLAVADGLGGHAGGEIASTIAVGALATVAPTGSPATVTSMLDAAVRLADDVIDATESDNADLTGMGTTLTAVAISGRMLLVCHIGDSRGYLLRARTLVPLTVDHTYIQSLIDAGRITEEQAAHHPQRSVVLRALGGGSATADISVRDLAEGDRVLLCSDGLSGVVPHEMLERVLNTYDDPTAAVEALVDLALLAGAPDNVTVVVGDVVDTPAPSHDINVLIGAAAEPRNQQAVRSDAIRDRLTGGSTPAGPAGGPSRTSSLPGIWGRWRLPTMFAAGVLVMLAVVRIWIFSQWWVGVDSDHVVIGRGIAQPVLGLNMGEVVTRTRIDVNALPEYDRTLLQASISAGSRTDAEHIAGRLGCRTTPISPECTLGQ